MRILCALRANHNPFTFEMQLVRAILIAMVGFVAADDASCLDHCKTTACVDLNGKLEGECGGCAKDVLCNPLAKDWKKADA